MVILFIQLVQNQIGFRWGRPICHSSASLSASHTAWLERTSIALESVTLWPESLRVFAKGSCRKDGKTWVCLKLVHPIQFWSTPTWCGIKVKGLTHYIYWRLLTANGAPDSGPHDGFELKICVKASKKGSRLITRRPYNTFDILSCWLLIPIW